MCGNGRNGEIGRGNKIESSAGYYSTPMLIDYFQDKNKKIIDVSCGRNHTLVLTDNYI